MLEILAMPRSEHVLRLQFNNWHAPCLLGMRLLMGNEKVRWIMYEGTDLEEYMVEIRDRVCSRCIERPPGGPPCQPLGKRCGVEVNLRELVEAVHQEHSNWMEPYIERFHEDVSALTV